MLYSSIYRYMATVGVKGLMAGVCSFCFVGPELPKVEGGEPDLSLQFAVIFVTSRTAI